MRAFIAKNGKHVFTSGYAHCIAWANQLDSDAPTVIHTVRGGEKDARVIAEVVGSEAVRHILNGQLIKVSKLLCDA